MPGDPLAVKLDAHDSDMDEENLSNVEPQMESAKKGFDLINSLSVKIWRAAKELG